MRIPMDRDGMTNDERLTNEATSFSGRKRVRIGFWAPMSIILFIALTLAGTYYVRKGILERALEDAITVGDAETIELLLRSWPCPLDAKGRKGAALLLWAADRDEYRVARICLEMGVPPVDQSWFPLEGIRHKGELDPGKEPVLAFDREQRWFEPSYRHVAKAEYDAWKKDYEKRYEVKIETKPFDDGSYAIPGPSRHRREAMDLPVEDQGVTLTLDASPTDNASMLRFDLTLTSRRRDVRRLEEIPWTTPFLFALYADGTPVTRKRNRLELEDQIRRLAFVDLVKSGGSRTWSFRVEAMSLTKVLPRGAREVTIIASFSDSEHEPWYSEAEEIPVERAFTQVKNALPQLLLRSNAVKLRLDSKAGAKE